MSYQTQDALQREQNRIAMKESVTQMMRESMKNIYRVCAKSCIKDYQKFDLSDREKICLSRCYEKKSETTQMTMSEFVKLTQTKGGDE